MSGASERANGRVSGPVLTSRFLADLNHSAILSQVPAMAGRVCQLFAGGRHDVLLTEDGEIFMWGSNGEGQLGNGNNVDVKEVLTDSTFFVLVLH